MTKQLEFNGLQFMMLFLLKFLRKVIDFLSDVIFFIIYTRPTKQCVEPIKNDILLLPATNLASKILSQELTSEEVVKSFIERIKDTQDALNAVVDERFDEAIKDAKKIDILIQQSHASGTLETFCKDKPFLGVPFTTKDCFPVKGLSFTAGLVKRRGTKAKAYGEAIKCFKKAGAIPVAVTNVSELCLWMESSNNLYGRSNNPYDIGRTPGGSSGGEGALLSAGGSAFGIGSDIGGSIRMPALFNGIFGHKPSSGIVSNEGQIPVASGILDTFLVTGPMSRFACDLLPLLRVMVKEEKKAILKLEQTVQLNKIKVFYMTDDGGNPLMSDIDKDLQQAQIRVVERWRERYGQSSVQMISLPRMFYSILIWANKMASEPSAPEVTQVFLADLTDFKLTNFNIIGACKFGG